MITQTNPADVRRMLDMLKNEGTIISPRKPVIDYVVKNFARYANENPNNQYDENIEKLILEYFCETECY